MTIFDYHMILVIVSIYLYIIYDTLYLLNEKYIQYNILKDMYYNI